jgi:hypothetical protein
MTTRFSQLHAPRLPLQPLIDEMGCSGISDFASRIGVSRWTVYRMQQRGLTVDEADQLAITAAGCHPFCIWGADFYADLSPVDSDSEWSEAA